MDLNVLVEIILRGSPALPAVILAVWLYAERKERKELQETLKEQTESMNGMNEAWLKVLSKEAESGGAAKRR